MDEESQRRLTLSGVHLKHRLVGRDFVDDRGTRTGRPREELRPVFRRSRSGNLHVQTLDIQGGQGWDVRGAMQTQDDVVSDKSGVRKIKPLVTANLNCAREGLGECR